MHTKESAILSSRRARLSGGRGLIFKHWPSFTPNRDVTGREARASEKDSVQGLFCSDARYFVQFFYYYHPVPDVLAVCDSLQLPASSPIFLTTLYGEPAASLLPDHRSITQRGRFLAYEHGHPPQPHRKQAESVSSQARVRMPPDPVPQGWVCRPIPGGGTSQGLWTCGAPLHTAPASLLPEKALGSSPRTTRLAGCCLVVRGGGVVLMEESLVYPGTLSPANPGSR
ncbi:hypothetical protein F4778DRAFT_438900 [Xylariomycetidae sp. FL2044]|nr:hypothetical protein F4778DRAFT_438900 [Xylariomycetidae sp. FL2044]